MGIAEDLDLIDNSIQMLQIAWDKFFSGVERKPPVELVGKIEALIRRYAYAEMRNNAERFRYQTLTARYNAFNEMWNKRLRAREEGRPMGLHGTRQGSAADSGTPAAVQKTPNVAAAPAREVRILPNQPDPQSMRALYEQFIAARRAAGDSTAVKIESFEKLIQQQTSRILTEKGARAVDFRVEARDGKVTLKAKPVT